MKKSNNPKKIVKWLACSLLILSILTFTFPQPAQALSPKAKVVAITAGYGAVAGALVGLASLAFGTNTRAIFVGASLGLYAGILVGTYLILFPPKSVDKPMEDEDRYPNERYSLLTGMEPLIYESAALLSDSRERRLEFPDRIAFNWLLDSEKQKPQLHLPLVQVSF